MQARQLPAMTGWTWIKTAFALFRQQPIQLLSLCMMLVFILLLLSVLPVVGTFIYGIILQGLSAGFLLACQQVEAGKLVAPWALVGGFRFNGGRAAKPLLILGVGYFLSTLVVLGLVFWVDDGTLMRLLQGEEVGSSVLTSSRFAPTLMLLITGHVLTTLAFWYAPALILWHGLPPLKALFFSVVTVWRNKTAFLVYGLTLLGIGATMQFFLGLFIKALALSQAVQGFLQLPLLASYAAVVYCSVYTSYQTTIVVSTTEETS